MAICVTSETAPLRQVLLHRPGVELEHLTPGTLERLLFDDIPYLSAAQREHDAFSELLSNRGIEVLYLEDLAAETIGLSQEVKEQFLFSLISEGGAIARDNRQELIELLSDIPDDRDLILRAMAGIPMAKLSAPEKNPLLSLVRREEYFALEPMPNLYFTRDPFASVGRGVCLSHMYSATRRRETLFARYIFKYHPAFKDSVKLYYTPECPFFIEGGDILNLSAQTLAIGISQRTSPEAIELLAGNMFSDEECPVNRILALDIPNMRAFMHLDTVLTQVDADKFTIHPGILESLHIYEIAPGGSGIQARELNLPLERALGDALGREPVTLIHCGGRDPIASEREQWNDASNTLCISPGTVVTYDRNTITNRHLREHGVTVLEVPSSELSRGRGGPRCMSMPLIRE